MNRDDYDDDAGLEDDEPDTPPAYEDLIRTFQSRYVSIVDRYDLKSGSVLLFRCLVAQLQLGV